MATDPLVTHLDFVSGASEVGPVGSVRLTRSATGIQASVDGAAVGLPIAAASASAAGSMSAADFSKLSNIPNGGTAEASFYTVNLDLTAAASGIVIVPAMPGFLFAFANLRLLTISKSGAISTSFTANGGNDGSQVNLFASQTPATTVFSSFAAPSYATLTQATLPLVLVDLTTAITVTITSGATGTGGFAWHGRIQVFGGVVPNS